MSNKFDMESEWVTELGKARSDEYMEKILAFVQELEKSAPEPFLPLTFSILPLVFLRDTRSCRCVPREMFFQTAIASCSVGGGGVRLQPVN